MKKVTKFVEIEEESEFDPPDSYQEEIEHIDQSLAVIQNGLDNFERVNLSQEKLYAYVQAAIIIAKIDENKKDLIELKNILSRLRDFYQAAKEKNMEKIKEETKTERALSKMCEAARDMFPTPEKITEIFNFPKFNS